MPNKLFYGDNLDMLRSSKLRDETVDLCYIDPPFNSKRTYNQIYKNVGGEDRAQAQAFVDTWIWDDRAKAGYEEIISNRDGRFTEQTIDLLRGLRDVLKYGSLLAYLVSITLRTVEVHRVLKPTGSFYLHCDPTCSHYLKLVLDSVFVPNGGDYRNEIIWKRTSARSDSHKWNHIHDVLFFYTKSDVYTWNTQYMGYDAEYVESFYKEKDADGSPFMSDNLTGAGTRGGFSGKSWRGIDPTSKSRHWALPKQFLDSLGITGGTVQDRLERLDAMGRVLWPEKENGVPRYKRYLKDMPGLAIQSMITDIPPLSQQSAERLGYPTQKPEALLKRIIEASTNPGDTILDAYCGCGTTVAVAQERNRRWIGMDITFQSISVVLKRLERDFGKAVADSVILDGIPRDMESAEALAHKRDDRLRKEFEKWAILTYTNNRAVINEKKGADHGIDGVAYILTGEAEAVKMLLQVKSGGVSRDDISTLRGDMEREGAKLGTLITLKSWTAPMRKEAKSAGTFTNPLTGQDTDKIAIVTVKQIVEEKARLDIPVSLEAVWKAKQAAAGPQMAFSFIPVAPPRKPPVREELPQQKPISKRAT
jgi:DNA modification methylase